MLVLHTITPSLFGYIFLLINLMFYMCSTNLRHTLRIYLLKRLNLNRLGGEYKKLAPYFDKFGILHRLSCAHSPQHNGSTKQKDRHIVEMGLFMR